MQVKKQQLEQTGSKLGKECIKAVYCHPAYLTYMQSSYHEHIKSSYIMRNTGLDESQARIKTARRNINNLRYTDDTTLTAESEELKSLLMKDESENLGLKLNFQKTKIMASGLITPWQIDGKTWKQ